MKKRHPIRILAMEPICGSCACKTGAHFSGSRRPCRVRGCECKAWTVPSTKQYVDWLNAKQARGEARA